MNDHENPTALWVHLKHLKCDQFGLGADVFVGQTDNELCPVAVTLTYFVRRGGAPGPLFIDKQHHPLTKARLVARIRGVLEMAGYPTAQFARHSFRISTYHVTS